MTIFCPQDVANSPLSTERRGPDVFQILTNAGFLQGFFAIRGSKLSSRHDPRAAMAPLATPSSGDLHWMECFTAGSLRCPTGNLRTPATWYAAAICKTIPFFQRSPNQMLIRIRSKGLPDLVDFSRFSPRYRIHFDGACVFQDRGAVPHSRARTWQLSLPDLRCHRTS